MANQALTNALNFRDATRQQAKACIVIQGLSGKGKSGLALAIGYVLAKKRWEKIFSVDTENKSLDLFEGLQLHTGDKILPFKKLDLLPTHGYAPSNYLICKENAKKAGAEVFIADSITHMWQMKGGILQRVTAIEQANSKVNKFTAWGTDEIVDEKNAIYDVVRDSNIHVITTVRLKEKHEFVDGKVNSLGEQQIFMPDFKYEPDLVLDMMRAGNPNGTTPAARVIKSRYAIFEEGATYDFTEALIQQLADYLEEGTDPAVLQEQQRIELIAAVHSILETDVSKKTMYPVILKQQGLEDVKLADTTLAQVRTILGILIN